MLRKGGQRKLTADLNKVRERAMWIYGGGTVQTHGTARVETLRCSVAAGMDKLKKAAVTGTEQTGGRMLGCKLNEVAVGVPHRDWPYRPWKGI